MGNTVAASDTTRRRAAVLLGALALLTVVAYTVSPAFGVGDSRLSVVTAWAAVDGHGLDVGAYPQVQALSDHGDLVAHGGRLLPFFPWPPMLTAIPAVLVYRALGHDPAQLSISDPNRTFLLEAPTAAVLLTLALFPLYGACRRAAGGSRRTALLAAAVFAFATSAWSTDSRSLQQHTVSILFLALSGVLLQKAWDDRRWAWWLGLTLAVGAVCRPTDAVFAVIVVVAFAVVRRPDLLVRLLPGLVVVVGLFVLVSRHEYGSLLPPYYVPGRYAGEKTVGFWSGLGVDLVSPSRGLLFFDPVLLTAAVGFAMRWRRRGMDATTACLGLACVGQLLAVAAFGSTGGATYGPRLMTDIVPFLVILSVPVFELVTVPRGEVARPSRAVVAGLVVVLGWSVFVNATGAVLRAGYCWSATPVTVDAAPQRVWDWSDPQFLRPYRDLAAGHSLRQVTVGSCTPTAPT